MFKKIINTTLFCFISIVVATASNAEPADYSELDIHWLGCPDLGIAPVASICGTVRRAMPTDTNDGNQVAGDPIEGVTIAIYEYMDINDDGSINPTGKKAGALTHLFSSTDTNEEGRFFLPVRRIGAKQIRYMAYVCSNGVGDVITIPSYLNLDFTVYIDCDDGEYQIPPEDLQANSFTMLSCDMKNPDATSSYDFAREVNYSREKDSRVIIDEWATLSGADPRYKEYGAMDPIFQATHALESNPREGAYWSRDCRVVYNGRGFSQFCRQEGESIEDYEYRATHSPEFLVENILGNIAPADQNIFYKEFSPRVGFTSFVIDPATPLRFNSTVFGNCLGPITARPFGIPIQDALYDCEEIKKCSQAISTERSAESYRNALTTGGYTQGMASPGTWDTLVGMPDPLTEICTIAGQETNPVKFGEIQPDTALYECDTECGYRLDNSYYSKVMALYFSPYGATSKWSYGSRGSNTSVGTVTNGANARPYTAANEKMGIPQKEGTQIVFPNGIVDPLTNKVTNANNSLATSSYLTQGEEPATDMMSPPFFNDEEALNGVPIVMKGSGNPLCQYSNINDKVATTVSSSNEDLFFYNFRFQGNSDHYPESIAEVNPEEGSRTPSTAAYFTSVAKRRMEAFLTQRAPMEDFYDGILTASYGDGNVALNEVVASAWNALLGLFQGAGSQPVKLVFDRKTNNAIGSIASLQSIDDLRVENPISEESFEGHFPLPTIDFHPASWGSNACYPWEEMDVGERCRTEGEIDGVSRTCRADYGGRTTKELSYRCVLGSTGYTPSDESTEVFHTEYNNDGYKACAQGLETTIGREELMTGSSIDLEASCTASDMAAYCNEALDCTMSGDIEGCIVSFAGPLSSSSECIGTLEKDIVHENKQEPMEEYDPSLIVDQVPVADNMIAKLYQDPKVGSQLPLTYYVGAEHSTINSINQEDPSGENSRGKDQNDAPGGAAKGTLMSYFQEPTGATGLAALETYTLHCNNSELEGSGPWACPLIDVPDPEIIDLDDLDVDSSCALNPSQACINALNEVGGNLGYGSLGDYNFSETFVTELSAAGTFYNVPASALLAYMSFIGKTYTWSHLWNDAGEQNLIQGSAPWYGVLGNCDNTSASAVGPFDWIQSWFNAQVALNGAAGLESIARNRSITANRCNFLDAAYVASAALHVEGLSCGDWDWGVAYPRVFHLAWGYTGQETDENAAVDSLSAIFNACKR